MVNEVIVAVLVLVSVIFLVMEIFIIPGISVCAIISFIFGGVAVWYSFTKISVTAGLVTMLIWLVVLGIGIWIFVRSRTLDKMSLNTELKDTSNLYEIDKVKVGDSGTAYSRLAPMGKVTINDREFEAKSADGFIDQKSEVEVVGIEDNKLIVKLKK
ncbi:MAG: NfeD family protein [Paludibacteraceae bacterium]|nr:NfeD family protein [Paludibacteraceae bacterium]